MSVIFHPGAAIELADEYVEKAISAWVAKFTADALAMCDRQSDNLDAAFRRYRPTLGGPAGQMKLYRAIRDGYGDALISSMVATGKRCRFSMSFDFITVSAPHARSREDIATAAKWPSVVRMFVTCDGAGRDVQINWAGSVEIARHVIKRLVERVGVVSADEINRIIRDAWPTVSIVERVAEKVLACPVGTSLIIPARVTAASEPVAFIAAIEDTGFVIRTALTWSMLRPRQAWACNSFLQRADGHDLSTAIANGIVNYAEDVRGLMNL